MHGLFVFARPLRLLWLGAAAEMRAKFLGGIPGAREHVEKADAAR